MSKVIVIGAGFSGSAAALMLAADGHEVVVVDRDPGPVPAGPDEAWEWDRRSIRQYRFAHGLLPRGHGLMARYFPHLVERLREHGGLELNLAHAFIDLIPGSSHRSDDDRFAHGHGPSADVRLALGERTRRRAGDHGVPWRARRGLAARRRRRTGRGPRCRRAPGRRDRATRRPRRRRRRAWLTRRRPARGHRCAAAAHRRARQRVRVHRPLLPLPGRRPARAPGADHHSDGLDLAAHPAGRPRHVGGDGVHPRRRCCAASGPPPRRVRPRPAGLPAPRPLDRRRADPRHRLDERRRQPRPPLRRRRRPGGHRSRRTG